ncbi:MAG: DUF3800 domain-containing protein [Leifsonia sp.]
MYLLYVDESGVHDGPHPFVLGAIAVHERDASRLQRRLEAALRSALPGHDEVSELELHGSEIWNAPARSGWSAFDRTTRATVLRAAYRALSAFAPTDPSRPLAAFGVIVDRTFRPRWSDDERERWAYEVLLRKFDAMVARKSILEAGLVIHDRRRTEPRIQAWARRWRNEGEWLRSPGRLAEVPLFADSRVSRLVQAADLVSYALFREYGNALPDQTGAASIRSLFDSEDGRIHGLVHFSPGFGAGACDCIPCVHRLRASAEHTFVRRIPRSQVTVMPLS